jgi:hypothetical protein
MAYALLWWPDADAAMDRLERDPTLSVALNAVRRTLGRLELDSFDRRLLTRQFVTPQYGHIRATPCRSGDWYVLWQPGEGGTVEMVIVAELAL